MPKVLILFAGTTSEVVDNIANGARSVRFSEVEVRHVATAAGLPAETSSGSHPTFQGAEELVQYDAIVLALSSLDGELDAGLRRVLDEAAALVPRTVLQNKVGSAFIARTKDPTASAWPALTRIGDMGFLVVSPEGTDPDAAAKLGARVAQVAAWVAHVRSHHHHAH